MQTNELERLRKNRENAKKSTGPHDTRQSRYNAIRHGLTAKSLTELDDRLRFEDLRRQLDSEMRASGVLEHFLLDRIALTMIRIERASQLEAQRIQEQLHPPIYGPSLMDEDFRRLCVASERELLDPGTPAMLPTILIGELGDTYTRYETALDKRLERYLAQLERLQIARRKSGPAAC
jgi:hypothetical protein